MNRIIGISIILLSSPIILPILIVTELVLDITLCDGYLFMISDYAKQIKGNGGKVE